MCKISSLTFKKQLLIVLFLLGCISCFAQNDTQKSEFWKNVRFGGSAGLGFSNGGFNGAIAPSAIYQFNDQFAAGTSLNLNYSKFNESKFLAYGGSILSLFTPIPRIQLSAEFEQLRINQSTGSGAVQMKDNYWSPALFFGAGYAYQNITVGIRYDVIHDDKKSIYPSALLPFIRVYF